VVAPSEPHAEDAIASARAAEEIKQLEGEIIRLRTEEEARRAEVEASRLSVENALRGEQERWRKIEEETARTRAEKEKQRIEIEALALVADPVLGDIPIVTTTQSRGTMASNFPRRFSRRRADSLRCRTSAIAPGPRLPSRIDTRRGERCIRSCAAMWHIATKAIRYGGVELSPSKDDVLNGYAAYIMIHSNYTVSRIILRWPCGKQKIISSNW
jgi:hypothetical protein